MSNFALTSLALSSVCPTNKVIVDDKGDPSVMVERPAQMLNALLTNGDSTVHPAFLVNGVQRKKLAFGKFQSIVHNSRTYSLPNEDPAANITLDEIEQYSKNKGNGFHCITYMEWGFLALLAKKNGHHAQGQQQLRQGFFRNCHRGNPDIHRHRRRQQDWPRCHRHRPCDVERHRAPWTACGI